MAITPNETSLIMVLDNYISTGSGGFDDFIVFIDPLTGGIQNQYQLT